MNATALFLAVTGLLGPVSDPSGDLYSPADPCPALPAATHPDLILGSAVLDAAAGVLRFEFTFTDAVYPADDFAHFDAQLHGFVDIDLDSPPTDERNSKKSALSCFGSTLGIEAYIDLGLVASPTSTVPLFADGGGLVSADVPIEFNGATVTIGVPLADLDGLGAVGDEVAYAALFLDFGLAVADVFPNGDGYHVSELAHQPLPAVSGWNLIATALLLLAAGTVCIRLRRRVAVT